MKESRTAFFVCDALEFKSIAEVFLAFATHTVTRVVLTMTNTPLKTIFIHFGGFLPIVPPPSPLPFPAVCYNFSISTCQLWLLLLLCDNSRDPPADFHLPLPFSLATPSTSPRAGRPVSMYTITLALALAAIRGPGRANPSPDIDPGEVGGG